MVIYDITDDNLRLKVAETLKDYGLERIQYSAFMGYLRRDRLNSLVFELKKLIGDACENVQIYPLCDTCYRGMREVGKHKKYVWEEERSRVAYF